MADATTKTKSAKKKAPSPKGGGKKACTVQGCKRAYRAKGLCFFHYQKWRRGEMEGRPARYGTCSKPDCKKKVAAHGLCQEHFDAWKKGRKKNQVATPEAAPAAPAAPTA
ncbi:MAG TPA: hypothetical protein VLT61_00500 [Anaeromyxobacteraceae bacterium]|nr:hypothetical protein [Anaeromyxobacteraceae bacterium]